jgi:hypothetical protein
MSTDHFAGINDGDKIRVEFADGALEGVWAWKRGKNGWARVAGTIDPFGRDDGNALCVYESDIEERIVQPTILRRALPPEPRRNTVVLTVTASGRQRVFQLLSDGCWYSAGSPSGSPWAEVCDADAQGMPIVLWDPEGGA